MLDTGFHRLLRVMDPLGGILNQLEQMMSALLSFNFRFGTGFGSYLTVGYLTLVFDMSSTSTRQHLGQRENFIYPL